LAAILDEINHTRREHIITLEDPIEYLYQSDRCLINQREVGTDTESYPDGLRAILREDPDIILIGEMRDPITIETALVQPRRPAILSLQPCTPTRPSIRSDRLVGVFPAERQPQIRLQLSTTLRAVVSQQLLPKRVGHGGRVLASEIMVVTPAIRNLIREGKTPQLQNALLTAAKRGLRHDGQRAGRFGRTRAYHTGLRVGSMQRRGLSEKETDVLRQKRH
jgi:twitching motility protein PilT